MCSSSTSGKYHLACSLLIFDIRPVSCHLHCSPPPLPPYPPPVTSLLNIKQRQRHHHHHQHRLDDFVQAFISWGGQKLNSMPPTIFDAGFAFIKDRSIVASRLSATRDAAVATSSPAAANGGVPPENMTTHEVRHAWAGGDWSIPASRNSGHQLGVGSPVGSAAGSAMGSAPGSKRNRQAVNLLREDEDVFVNKVRNDLRYAIRYDVCYGETSHTHVC